MIFNVIRFALNSVSRLSPENLSITIIIAIVFSLLTGLACHFLYKLWNKAYKTTITHKIISILSSVLSFFFILLFVGIIFLEDMAKFRIDNWEQTILKNPGFQRVAFEKAYYAVKKTGNEDFTNYPEPGEAGSRIPLSKPESIVISAKTTYDETISNFKVQCPLLSQILDVSSKGTKEEITSNVKDFFKDNPNSSYPFDKSIKIAVNNIRDSLKEQAPKIVDLARIILIISFITVQLIPFGIISYSAYKDLKVRN
jgi:hypothetical protein